MSVENKESFGRDTEVIRKMSIYDTINIKSAKKKISLIISGLTGQKDC